ncbi:unnamed protein product [Brassica rapa subsp. narinosa]
MEDHTHILSLLNQSVSTDLSCLVKVVKRKLTSLMIVYFALPI